MTKRDWLYLCLITLLAAALRFYQLDTTPPGPQFDEAYNAIDASQVLAGNRPLFLPANGGREVLYTYYQAALGLLFGRLDLFTLRFASALAGTLTVAALYVTVRMLFQRSSQTLAILTSLTLAISYWHVHFSHFGIRIILMPLILCGVFGLFWLGMATQRPGVRWFALTASGVLTGLGVWANPTGRFVPFVLIVYVLWLLWRYPQQRRFRTTSPLFGLFITGAVAFIVFLPLGLEFVRHPEFFFGHASEVSVFAERVSGERSPWMLLGNNILRVLGMFSFDGDPDWTHGFPDRPVFDWFLAIPFYIGVAGWTVRLLGKDKQQPDPDRDALFLFMVWAVVMLAPSVLSENAPNYSRTLAAAPPVMLGAGLGLTWIASRVQWSPHVRYGVVGLLLTASAAVTTVDYFVRYPAHPHIYHAFDADKVDAVEWMKMRGEEGYAVYLSPLWATHATVTFLRNHHIRSLDATQAIVLPPPGKGAIYAFPAEQFDYAAYTAEIWGEPVSTLNGRNDQPLLHYVEIDAAKAQIWPESLAPTHATNARFDDAPTLIGMRIDEDARSLYLHWQAEAETYRNLTAFVHLVNEIDQRIGQIDVTPGDGTFTTPTWRSGERVVQRFTPEIIDGCSGGEEVRILTGWYEYAAGGALRPRLDAPGSTALAGKWIVPFRSMPMETVRPGTPAAEQIPPHGLVLIGYTPSSTTTEPGAPFTLDLYFQGSEQQRDQIIGLALHGDESYTLDTGILAPGAAWRDGEAVCRRFQMRIPADAAPGAYQLHLAVDDNFDRPITEIQIEPSSRLFESPPISRPIQATLGGAIRLQGVNLERSDDTLAVQLVWQTLQPVATSEQVFVHLVGPAGDILAQSDALPAGGYRTEQWVAGEFVIDEHRLMLPPEAASGDIRLRVGMYDPLTGERLAVVDRDGRSLPDDAISIDLSP